MIYDVKFYVKPHIVMYVTPPDQTGACQNTQCCEIRLITPRVVDTVLLCKFICHYSQYGIYCST